MTWRGIWTCISIIIQVAAAFAFMALVVGAVVSVVVEVVK
jgi:uncharacterized membrane protein